MLDFTSTSQWRRVRREVLERDGYICHIRGPRCTKNATAVDHIVPVEDGGALYDPANLRAACARCNSWRANRQKAQDGWRRSATRITLVVGPVGAGKSTYIQEHAGPRDLIIDYDAIARALGGASHDVVSAARNALLNRVRRGEVEAERVWIHSANPDAENLFPHHEVVLIDPGRDEVLRRCNREMPPSFIGLVESWYDRREAKQTTLREW